MSTETPIKHETRNDTVLAAMILSPPCSCHIILGRWVRQWSVAGPAVARKRKSHATPRPESYQRLSRLPNYLIRNLLSTNYQQEGQPRPEDGPPRICQ